MHDNPPPTHTHLPPTNRLIFIRYQIAIINNCVIVTDEQTCDPRTVDYLKSFISKTPLNQQTINDLACNLLLRQTHRDEIKQLQDQIASAQTTIGMSLRSNSTHSTSSDTGSDRSTSTSTSTRQTSTMANNGRPDRSTGGSTDEWMVTGRAHELEMIIKQKDDIIRRREEEYDKLKKIMTDMQDDLQSVLDLNNQYLGIIGQMNQMQMHQMPTPRMQDKDTAMLEMERKLEETHSQMEQLEGEIAKINTELQSKEDDLDVVQQREKRYKEKLGLLPDATEEEVDRKIDTILEEGSMRKQEVDRIQRELKKVVANRQVLQEKLTTLTREKDKVEFHMRQQELTMKKMKRMRVASNVLQNADRLLAEYDHSTQAIRLPTIQRPPSQLSLATSRTATGSLHQYCVFCRTEYQPMKAHTCRIHFRPIRSGQWTCCKDDCHRSAGCLQVPHFYIEITVDKKVFLTDGARYMELA